MIKRPRPIVDIAQYIGQIVADRQNGVNADFFTGIEPAWIQRCESYENVGGDPSLIAKWPAALPQAQSFRTLYANPAPGHGQTAVLTTLRDRKLKVCPVCGEAGTPNTLDHYLPQQDFPDFSILPANLVPTCDICQGHKLAHYLGPDGRLFVHPYFDAFLDQQVARLEFVQPLDLPAVRLVVHPDLDLAHHSLVHRHFTALRLHERLQSFIETEWMRVLRLAGRERKKGRDIEQAVRSLADHAADRSVNAWEHLLWEGILSDAAMLDFLNYGQLPSNN